MPIVQPQQTRSRSELLAVVADESHVLHGASNFLENAYFVTDEAGEIIVHAGLIVAQHTANKKYVPYNASPVYGPGSDTAVGVLHDPQDATYDEPTIAPIVHGKLIEAHCYVYGQNGLGSIPAAVKTDLDDIHWV